MTSIHHRTYVGIEAKTIYDKFEETIPAVKQQFYDKEGSLIKEEIIKEEYKDYNLSSVFDNIDEDDCIETILEDELDMVYFDGEGEHPNGFFGLLVGEIDCYESPFLRVLNVDFIKVKQMELQTKLAKLGLDTPIDQIKVFTYIDHSC